VRMSWLERARPDAVAVETADGALTYGDLLARARAAAAGLPVGGRVAIALPPGLDFAVALHACLLAGAAAMPVDLRLAEPEREAMLARADAAIGASVTARGGSPTSAALIVHTSGTTGSPRPVELSRGNIEANARGCALALGQDPDERWLCPLPLSHVGGLMVLLRSAIHGTTAVLDHAGRDDVTIASLVPTQLARLLEAGAQPGPRLRVIMLGGAPADPTLLVRARDAGWPVAPTYGLTQACSAVTVAEPGDVETSGRPLRGLDVTIAAERSGDERAARGSGEILVTGPTVAGGGTLRTGDLGRLDEQGRLIVSGRKADTIVTGGENVMPQEVEAALLQHPAVAEAGVYGRPDPEWGEAVAAAVVLRAPADPDDLRAHCASRLARFKVPKTIEVVDALPRNAAGKLLRRRLG
jgi:o-succinylbenzoate---CoA ligase